MTEKLQKIKVILEDIELSDGVKVYCIAKEMLKDDLKWWRNYKNSEVRVEIDTPLWGKVKW